MGHAGDAVGIDALLAHRDWVRRVARSLVLDEARAADLEQEVWLRALEHPPREDRGLRGWLATLLRNTAWKARRAEDRRGRREGDAPSPSPAPSPADLVAEAETHERVVRAVLSLEEPFRSTVLLRWFEDLPPQEMSRRLGVPPDTVKSRLRRAQESLRAKLTSEEEGDARRWMALLVPLARAARPGTGSAPSPPDTGPAPGPTVPATAATAASGGIAMAMGSKAAAVAVAAAALLFLAGGTAFLLGRDLGEAAGPVVPPGHRGPMPPAAEGDAPSSPGAALDPGPPDRAALLEITVTDLSGQPVAGAAASLHLQPREEIARHALHAAAPLPAAIPALRSGTTDAGGRCLLEFPDGEVFALVVNATGYAPAAREFPRPGTAGDRTPVAIALERACSLEGVVIDAAGKPVAGAEVRARNQRPPAEPPWNGGAATTGTDGRFRIEGLPPVAQNLTVEYGPLEWKSWQVRLPSTRPLTLRIPAGGMTVLGTVVAEGTGLPVEGASVVLDVEGREPSPLEPPSEGSSARARVVTGEDGTFRVEGVVPGRIAGVSVLAEGFLPWPARTANVARTDPTPAGGTATVEVRLRRGGVVTGRVTDPEGAPLAGAVVQPWSRDGETGRHGSAGSCRSGPDGTFCTGLLPPGPTVLLVHAPPPWRGLYQEGLPIFLFDFPGPPHVFDVPAEGEVRRDVRLSRGSGSVEGRVVDGAGDPVAGASVGIMFGEGYFGGGGIPGKTGPDGLFLVEAVAPGRRLRAWAGLSGAGSGTSAPFDLAEGGTVEGIPVVLLPHPPLTGRVVRSDGAPLRGAALYVVPDAGQGLTSWMEIDRLTPLPVLPDGSFVVEIATGGHCAIAATAEGCTPATSGPIEGGSGDLRIVLQPEAPLRGRVLDGEGAPVAGALVFAERTGAQAAGSEAGEAMAASDAGNADFEGPGVGHPPVLTGPEGEFSLGGLPAGPVRLHVRREGSVVVDAVAGGPPVEIRLPLFAPVAGRVLGTDGSPATGRVQVEVRIGEDGPWWTAPAAEDGSFTSIPLAPSTTYRVRASREDAEGFDVAYLRDVRAGTRDLELRLPSMAVLLVRVLDEEGRELPFEVLALAEEAAPGDPYGRILMAPAPGGGGMRIRADATLSYRIGAGGRTTGYLPHMLEGTHRPGGPPLEIRLQRGAVLAGTLRNARGDPLAGGTVRAEIPGIPSDLLPQCHSDDDGRFRLTGVPPGPVRLRTWSPERKGLLEAGTFTAPADGLDLRLE